MCGTLSNLLLVAAGLILAFYGVAARRLLSAVALAVAAYSVSLHLLNLVQPKGPTPSVAAAVVLSVAGFFIGFFTYRLAASLSAGYAVFVLIGRAVQPSLPLDSYYAVAVGVAIITYIASLRKAYIPYVVLGAATVAIALSTVTHAAVAIAIAALVSLAGYLVQEDAWRARMRLVKQKALRSAVKHRCSVSRRAT